MTASEVSNFITPIWNRKEDEQIYCWVNGHDESCLCQNKGFKKYGDKNNSVETKFRV